MCCYKFLFPPVSLKEEEMSTMGVIYLFLVKPIREINQLHFKKGVYAYV